MRSPIESALLVAAPWLVAGLGISIVGFLIPSGRASPTVLFIVQLTLLVALGLGLADRLAGFLVDDGWFANPGWSPFRRAFAAAVVLVIIPTGVVGLVTLASSATIGYDPSLQFLQLLSALDIVWAGAALLYGSFLLWGRSVARVAAALLGVVCVASLWNYLNVVGYGPNDEWLVDGGELARLVIPLDMLAAVVALVVVVAGLRRLASGSGAAQRSEQASDQS